MTSPSVSTHHVPSADGVTLAVHDLGGDGPPLVLCHPTGFHALVWAPVARHLTGWAHCWAVDFRGHGDTTVDGTDDLSWASMAADLLAVVDHVTPPGHDGPVLGVGHSMGGAALALAEEDRPGTFAGLWLFEPILLPPPEGTPPPSPLAAAARRRRPGFPDTEAAIAHYGAKPPLDGLDPEALRLYVEHGFRPAGGGDDDGVELKCTPETEARVFEQGMRHDGFGGLDRVACPTWVAASGDGGPPSQVAALVAAALPVGHLLRFPDLTHFGPMESPATIAASITQTLAPLD